LVGEGRREELRERADEIEDEDHDAGGDRNLVADELVPDQRPLARHRDGARVCPRLQRADRRAGFLDAVVERLGRHQLNRMRGSRRASRMSEISMPMSVRTPMSRMKLPARYMSCTVRARRSSGPAVGRL